MTTTTLNNLTRGNFLAYISKLEITCEILGSRSDSGEDPRFLGYNKVWIDK